MLWCVLMTALEVAQTTLALIIALFLLRVTKNYLEERNPASNVAAGLGFLIGQ